MMASKNPSDSLVSINGITGTLEFTALQNLYISSKLIIIGNIKKSAPYSIAILISFIELLFQGLSLTKIFFPLISFLIIRISSKE